jgi:lambda family phage minor tail protein L
MAVQSLFNDVSTLAPLDVVEMYVLDLPTIGTLRFHSGVNEFGDPLIWQGQEYTPYPLNAQGFERNAKGQLPRPRMRLSNYEGLMGHLLRQYNDCLGSRVTRWRTMVKYLDGVNFAAGNPNANPDKAFPPDVWYIARRVSEDPEFVEIELAAPWDTMGTKLPRRQVIASICPWYYRGHECAYTGPGYNVNNQRTDDPNLDQCAKTLSACRIRFGTGAILPYGGFPGSLLLRGGAS